MNNKGDFQNMGDSDFRYIGFEKAQNILVSSYIDDLIYEIENKELCVYIKNPSDVRVYPPGKIDKKTGKPLMVDIEGIDGKVIVPQDLSGYCRLKKFRIVGDKFYIEKLLVIDENGEVAEEREGPWECLFSDVLFKLNGSHIERNKSPQTAEDIVRDLLKRGYSDKRIAQHVDSIFVGVERLSHEKLGRLIARGRSLSKTACTTRALRARGLKK